MDLFELERTWPALALLMLLVFLLFHEPLRRLLQALGRVLLGFAALLLWQASGLFPSLLLGANLLNAAVIAFLGLPGLALLLFVRRLVE